MNLLTDDLLVEAYLSAIDHHLDQRFIKLLWSEISTRQLNVNKIN
ncbi:Sporulation inhibitor A [Amphibacillus marinus]|uniref:Sporulation inhibitor A n=1 Tax=Amphibacillus marinus TaxID=872970 RepID=A0A1H8IFF7_9BACI|nr:sporulation histidine kinase inhibitor Sda [Amphibacillus marinus]SEN67081.1 Sporulation inhibitor A [Amphibacillus marinus]